MAQCIERNDAAENKRTAHDFGRTLLMGAFSMSVQGPCYHLWTTTLQRLAARWQPIYVRPFARKHLPRHIVTQSRDQPLYQTHACMKHTADASGLGESYFRGCNMGTQFPRVHPRLHHVFPNTPEPQARRKYRCQSARQIKRRSFASLVDRRWFVLTRHCHQ